MTARVLFGLLLAFFVVPVSVSAQDLMPMDTTGVDPAMLKSF